MAFHGERAGDREADDTGADDYRIHMIAHCFIHSLSFRMCQLATK